MASAPNAAHTQYPSLGEAGGNAPPLGCVTPVTVATEMELKEREEKKAVSQVGTYQRTYPQL